MHGLRRRIGTGIATAGLMIIPLGLTAGTSFAAPPTDGACNGVWNGNPSGTLSIQTAPAANGEIEAGDVIAVTATWATSDWASGPLDKTDMCVTVDGAGNRALSDQERPAANDGSYQYAFTVPAGTAADTVVCVRVGVHGKPAGSNPSTQKSNSACFDVVAASTGGGSVENTGGGTTGGGDASGERGNDGGTTGGNNTQVQGASVTQTGGSTNNATQTNPTTEVSGQSLQAADETLAAAQSGSALPVTAGAIGPRALASTGSPTQTLLLLGGLALLLGGVALSFSSPRRAIA